MAGNVPDAPLEDCRISIIGNKGVVAGSQFRDQFRRMVYEYPRTRYGSSTPSGPIPRH